MDKFSIISSCDITINGADYIIENNHDQNLITPNPIQLTTTNDNAINATLLELQDHLNHNLSMSIKSTDYVHFTNLTLLQQLQFIEYLIRHADIYKQNKISQIVDAMNFGKFKRHSGADDTIRINSLASKRSGSWMISTPTTPYLEIKNRPWTILMKFRIDINQCNNEKKCNACENTNNPYTMGPKARHVLLCAKFGQYGIKHDNIKNLLYTIFRKAHWNPRREVEYLFGTGRLRPADVYIPNYRHGKALCIDVTIPNVMAPSRYTKQLKDKNYVFQNAINAKNKLYKKKCEENELLFMPFVMDTYGRIETNSFKLLKEICEPMAENTGYSKVKTMDYIFRSISMTLMKSIAKKYDMRIRE